MVWISSLSVLQDVLCAWASPLPLEVMAPLDLLDLLLELLQDLLLLCLGFVALNIERVEQRMTLSTIDQPWISPCLVTW